MEITAVKTRPMMTKYQNPIKCAFLLAFCSIILFIRCKKDRFDSINNLNATEKSFSKNNLSLSVDQAKDYFDLVNVNRLSMVGSEDSAQYHFVDINPVWPKAQLDTSELGRPMVVVPLNDARFRALNNGSTTATLLFSRISADTILAELLISIADSAYFQSNQHQLTRNNYTGWFLFFDIAKHFKYGINVVNGSPNGKITGLQINRTAGNNAQERNDDDCIIAIDYGYTMVPCAGMTLDECYETNYILVNICDEGGVSSSGGGGGPNNTGTGTGTGNGNGGNGSGQFDPNELNNPWAVYAELIASGQIHYWEIWFYGIPLHIFEYYGGNVPTPTEASLTQLNAKCNFSSQQLIWLQNRTSLLSLIASLLQDHNYSASIIDALKDVIDARTGSSDLISWAKTGTLIEIQEELDLPQNQLKLLIEPANQQNILSVNSFLEKHGNEDDAKTFVKDHLNDLTNDLSYKQFVNTSFGWPGIVWTIAKELLSEKAIDIAFNLVPGFNKKDEIRDGIKAIANGDWLEFTWEAAKIVVGQVPLIKALDVADQLRDLWKIVDKISNILGEIGEAAIERSWAIIKNSPIKFNANAFKYVNDIKFPKLGGYFATINTFNPNFKNKFSEVSDKIGEVHHAVPQQVLTKYPNLGITNNQMHSLENLRGIPNDGSLDHTTITNYWAAFFNTNPNASTQELLEFAEFIDDEFGHLFIPPVR